jgi:hypothetical protein
VLDVMPLDPDVLGFSNPWYGYAIESAADVPIAPGVVIRAVSAPAFVATKFAAYAHRGADDPLTSADLEDIITVVAGRPSLLAEVRGSPAEVRAWIARATRALLADPRGLDVLEGSLPDARYDRTLVPRMEARLRALASPTDSLSGGSDR